ncbi:MAG TPA: glycosyltransferase [Chloroflexota bacterium]
MRVLFTTTPGAGHVAPLLPLARAVAQSGHDVAFAGSVSLRPSMQAAGFESFTAGRWIAEQPGRAGAHAGGATPYSAREASIVNYLEVMVESNTRFAVPDLIPICRQWRPDIVVREEAEFGGAVAAEHLGVAHAAVQVLFFHGRTGLEGAISKRLDRIRGEWDLSPDPHLEMLHRYLFLSFTPPSFIRSKQDIPSTMHFLKRAESDEGTELGNLLSIELPLRRPVIYATLGTNMSRPQYLLPDGVPDVLPTLISSLQSVAGTLIVTVGRDRDPTEFGDYPPHVHVEQYVPQHLIFPHCDLVVTHGGHNTVIPALGHGLPLVLIPFWSDQPDNAQRCTELGVGQVIEPLDVTPNRLRSGVEEVLRDPGYRQRAQGIREEMRGLPSIEHGVALLEELARTKTPLLAGAES